MNALTDIQRRSFLKRGTYSVGMAALGSMLAKESQASQSSNPQPHFPGTAKTVIHLCMAGGPSHLETLDPKPELDKINDQPFPASMTDGQQLAQLQGAKLVARGAFCKFKKWGESGLEISELFPHIGSVADDLCIIRSMHTEQINHDPAHAFMNTGSIQKGRPSMGSWLLYGLGAETESLPGFIVFTSQGRYGAQPVSARQWKAGFLPSRFQGVQFQSRGDAVHYVRPPGGINDVTQKATIDAVNAFNRDLLTDRGDAEIATRISQYEMAFRMQASVPELADMSDESKETLELYGVKQPGDGSFASNCLMARRLAERGVRFIQLYHRAWDHHGSLEAGMKDSAKAVDQASAALIQDLKQRGMLDETLVIWGGEFGRTPMKQGSGRDHHINAFSLFMAGGGIRGGMSYGNSDELGYRYLKDGEECHVRDLHATMLHACGLDHMRLSAKYQGLDVRLTGVEPARVLKPILKHA
ncbi:DUF1501 domain-containing protein [Rhodopirellula sp. JC740]|uniref:DUF1501 domain-containing protein n=1 Tax=Rhodopirellula halodulae TaxID=2894198 RepID=A0ABS8NEY8_9BACT|nr:DUF1501 domain-containing protein [Rhodopirellula sp. JC740]MCC9642122.1 DUF1501 domain-containing protein [Rhodopirellula sp. JC740]